MEFSKGTSWVRRGPLDTLADSLGSLWSKARSIGPVRKKTHTGPPGTPLGYLASSWGSISINCHAPARSFPSGVRVTFWYGHKSST